MWVLKKRDEERYLYISGNTYKLGSIDKCSTYLSDTGAMTSLTKHKSVFYIKEKFNLRTLDFDTKEVVITLK